MIFLSKSFLFTHEGFDARLCAREAQPTAELSIQKLLCAISMSTVLLLKKSHIYILEKNTGVVAVYDC